MHVLYFKRPPIFNIIANFRALGVNPPTSIVAPSTVTDATFRRKNEGILLFAVLAEFDGIGAPIAYIFVEKDKLVGFSPLRAAIQVLDQFPRPILELEFNPFFFGCDKNKSEINAIRQVWPSAKVQLCFWQTRCAIFTKMEDSSQSDTLLL